MKLRATIAICLGAAALGAAPAAARADGGYYGGAFGARAAGRSGAFVARADDPTAVAYNPAGLTEIGGTVVLVGDRISHNDYSFTRAPTLDWSNAQNGMAPTVSFPRVSSSPSWQVLEPLLAVASNLGRSDWAFALAAFAPPGVSREEFPVSGGQRYMMVRREAIFLNYAASAAWKHADWFGVGATVEWIHVPRLDYSLVIDASPNPGNAVSSSLDMLASTTGSDPFTLNAILGAWVRPRPFLQLAIAGQVVPAHVVTNSRLHVDPLVQPDPAHPMKVVLTRDGVPADDVNVDLPLPMSVRGGARYRHLQGTREVFDVELDLEYETWSRVNQFTVETHGIHAFFLGQDIPLDNIVIAKRWRDTLAVKLGGDWSVLPDRLAVRAGAFYETAAAEPAYANVDFPGGAMLGGSLGASLRFGAWELSAAYQARLQRAVSVSETEARVYQQVPGSNCAAPYTDPDFCSSHYVGQPAPAVNAGRYEAASHFLLLALSYRFAAAKEER